MKMAEHTTENSVETTPYHGDKILPEEDIIIIIIAAISSICLLAVILACIWRKVSKRKEDDMESELKPGKIIPRIVITPASEVPKDIEILIDGPIKNSLYDLNNPYIYLANSCKYF
ncbi:uncharacterized protein LOC106876068 [Octopus bimaculoides]|uniref:Uncharacterized protein n=1 Tax=Octopus bimaculoides TaxID=37653 RepID=A0A0L8GLB7_OCTBM|nr:uncharacterized protein LOC106876068 [Octopus bimaculoides]|eukprot:XP_014779961.1 PREDICTED: uncharacterized protein LOC106876068 [Octopus bimaculoides]